MNCIDFTTKVCGCARNFHLAHGVWQKEVTQWDPRSDHKARVAGLGLVPQKLKQFADIVYRFSPQKRSKFETVG